ncbi:MAG: hypothetical protein AAFQ37_04815, partial [Bacteroidota bacterium]
MKKLLLAIVGVLLCAGLRAQATFDLQVIPVCWQFAADQDSTLYAYWLMSSQVAEPRLISYLNVTGNQVDISGGGAIDPGLCCCKGTSGASTIDATRLFQDSVLVYTQNGIEIGRDTIPLGGG